MDEEKINKTLIISPHLDDEVYGCSSYLKDGENTIVLYVTTNHALTPSLEINQENETLIDTLKFQPLFIGSLQDKANQLDLIGQRGLINEFEKLINERKPSLVLIPSPSYNQDHRAVYDAALTAMRPHDRNFFVKRILVYEQPDTFGTIRSTAPLRATYYRELDLTFKLELMLIYKSQMRGHRTPEHVEAIARVRGMQANMEFAEAFEVLRWVE